MFSELREKDGKQHFSYNTILNQFIQVRYVEKFAIIRQFNVTWLHAWPSIAW